MPSTGIKILSQVGIPRRTLQNVDERRRKRFRDESRKGDRTTELELVEADSEEDSNREFCVISKG